jgi:predicted amidophosphoribosyltransferase
MTTAAAPRTTPAPDRVPAIARALARSAGGYLRNTIREPHLTCATCTTPIPSDAERCRTCTQRLGTTGIADLVVPLTYAVAGAPSHELVRDYKDDFDPAVRARLSRVLEQLLFCAVVLHQNCIEHRIGRAIDRRLVIPSLSGRTGVHPLAAIATRMNAHTPTPALQRGAGATGERVVSGEQFRLHPRDTDLRGEHVLLLDDTWTSGSRTQSAALTLRRHGAAHVSVLVIGRYLKPGPNAAFIQTRLRRDYDPYCCPVTGGECP